MPKPPKSLTFKTAPNFHRSLKLFSYFVFREQMVERLMPPNDFLSSGLIGHSSGMPLCQPQKPSGSASNLRVVFGAIRSDTNWCEHPEFATDTPAGWVSARCGSGDHPEF
jgi:hypothetical protein